jgi:hypothetical protein
MADVSSTASIIVALVAPYLSELARGTASQVVRSDRPWRVASALAERLDKETPTVADAMHDLEKNPDDEDARAALRFQLRKVMESDGELAEVLADLVASAASGEDLSTATSGRTTPINVSIGGDMFIPGSPTRM